PGRHRPGRAAPAGTGRRSRRCGPSATPKLSPLRPPTPPPPPPPPFTTPAAASTAPHASLTPDAGTVPGAGGSIAAAASSHPGPSTTEAPGDAPVAAPAVPARIAEVARRRTGTVEQIVVRLDPPELGTVRIAVTARGDQVHVALRAATPEARAALEGQRERI